MTKLLTIQEIEKMDFESVLQMNIGDNEFDDVKVCITDNVVVIDNESDEQYVVYCTIGARNYNYVIGYSEEVTQKEEEETEEEKVDEADVVLEELEKAEAVEEETKEETEKKGFWGIKI